jgi:hypothetical protein
MKNTRMRAAKLVVLLATLTACGEVLPIEPTDARVLEPANPSVGQTTGLARDSGADAVDSAADATLPKVDGAPPKDAGPKNPCETTSYTQELCVHAAFPPSYSAEATCEDVPFRVYDGGKIERPEGREGCEIVKYGEIPVLCCPLP